MSALFAGIVVVFLGVVARMASQARELGKRADDDGRSTTPHSETANATSDPSTANGHSTPTDSRRHRSVRDWLLGRAPATTRQPPTAAETRREGLKLYREWGGTAYTWKVRLQMLIGAAILVGLVLVLLGVDSGFIDELVRPQSDSDASAPLITGRALRLVGSGLAFAAGIELAYTLFTRGPDEAIDPILLAFAAALLIQLARVETFHLKQAVAALLFAVALALLFAVQHRVTRHIDRESEPSD